MKRLSSLIFFQNSSKHNKVAIFSASRSSVEHSCCKITNLDNYKFSKVNNLLLIYLLTSFINFIHQTSVPLLIFESKDFSIFVILKILYFTELWITIPQEAWIGFLPLATSAFVFRDLLLKHWDIFLGIVHSFSFFNLLTSVVINNVVILHFTWRLG